MKYLIIGEPKGNQTIKLIELGVDPADIYVWEDSTKGKYCVTMEGATVTDNLDDYAGMRFDVVIGNPPYQDSSIKAKNNKLWHKFVVQALELLKDEGVIHFVTPTSVISDAGFGSKFLSTVSSNLCMSVMDYTADNHFDVGVSVCQWTVYNKRYDGKTRVIRDNEDITIDLRDGLPMTDDEKIQRSIIDKIANSNHDRIPLTMGQGISKDEYIDDGQYEIYSSGQTVSRTNTVPTTGNELKFIAPFSSSHKKRFISDGYVGMLNCWCPVTESTGERYSQIFDLPLIDFFITKYKRSSGFTPAVKNAMIPDVDPNSDMIVEFNLTDNEVSYLKSLSVPV